MTNSNEKNDKDKYILQSVTNALEVLEILSEHKNMSVPEIVEISGLGKSSVFRILATLEAKNYVQKTKDARYSLDVKLVNLGRAASGQIDLILYGHDHLEMLTQQSGETSHMSVLFHSIYCRFIDKVISTSPIHMDSSPGFYSPAHYMASGKMLLASSSEDVIENYIRSVTFQPLTKNSIMTPEALRTELAAVRANGYAVDHEESEYGLTCVAAPIWNYNGHIIAAVSVSGPTTRMLDNMAKNITLVKRTAENISQTLISLSNQP